MKHDIKYAIGELAELAGVSRRTIRYYVQRGFIPPPPGAGRGHYYTGEHLRRLLSIKLLQDRGLSLERIEQHLSSGESRDFMVSQSAGAPACPAAEDGRHGYDNPGPPPLEPSLWTRLRVADGVELHLEGGRYRLSPGRTLRLIRAVRAIIGDPFSPENEPAQGEDDHG